MYKLLLTLSLQTLVLGAHSQEIIWEEYFTDSTVVWTIDVTDCDGSPGTFFGVRNQRFEIQDMEGWPCCSNAEGGGGGNYNTWETGFISVANFSQLELSYEYASLGQLECWSDTMIFDCGAMDVIFEDSIFLSNGHDQLVFLVQRDTMPWQLLQYVCGSDSNFVFHSLEDADSLNIRAIGATKAQSEIYWFDNMVLTGNRVVATEDESATLQLSLSPNPFLTTLSIRCFLPTADAAELHVYNVLGQEVYTYQQFKAGENEILFQPPSQSSDPQLYWVVLQIGQSRIVRKVIGGG